jgi:serine/threonine protein kinase
MTATNEKGHTPAYPRQSNFKPALFGRYYLVDRMSRGGMSDIYLAKSVGLGGFQKPLIIKKLLPELSGKPRYVKRFMNEARTLAQLNHSNIVQVLDTGVVDGEYYIALEHVEGRNVAHLLSRAHKAEDPPSLEFCIYVVSEVAAGLAYSHRRKAPDEESLMLVHQDINSFNVMISYEAEVKIVDFGIARIFFDRSTWQGVPVAGKLLYFSPEQLKGKSIDRRVDIYGTGVLFYELLTGERLVDHQETVEQTVKMILKMDLQEKVMNNDRLRPELKPILCRSIARDPDDRYTWMEEMIDDMRAVLRALSLELDPREFSSYVKGLFQREMNLDRERMRQLLYGGPPIEEQTGSAVVPGKDNGSETDVSFSRDLFHLQAGIHEVMEGARDEAWRFPAQTVKVRAGKTIFRQEDPGSDLYVIQKGKVKIFVKSGTSTQTIAVLGKGELFGESGLLEDSTRGLYAGAIEDCTLIRIQRDTFFRLIPQDLSRKVISRLAERLRDATMLLGGSLFQDPLSRFIYALVFFHRRNTAHNGEEIDLRELTEVFGLEDDTQVKKYVSKLEALQILEVNENAVSVRDFEKLENVLKLLAGGGEFTMKL